MKILTAILNNKFSHITLWDTVLVPSPLHYFKNASNTIQWPSSSPDFTSLDSYLITSKSKINAMKSKVH